MRIKINGTFHDVEIDPNQYTMNPQQLKNEMGVPNNYKLDTILVSSLKEEGIIDEDTQEYIKEPVYETKEVEGYRFFTQEEFNQKKQNADKKNAKQALREEREEKLRASTVTYDGAEFQTRPSDRINFTTMLTLLQNDSDSIVWTLADDTEKTITKADLHAVYLLGLQAGAMIDKEYRDAVRAL